MRAREEACRILEAALSLASGGVDEAEVHLSGGDLAVTTFKDNQLFPGTEFSAELIGVRLNHEGRSALASTSDLSTDGLRRLVARLKRQLDLMPQDPDLPALPGPQTYRAVEAYDPEVETLRSLERVAWAGSAVMSALRHQLLASGSICVRRGGLDRSGLPTPYAVANTRGLLAFHAETHVAIQMEMRGAEGRIGRVEAGAFTHAVMDPDELVEEAVERAQTPGALRNIPPGRYEAVLGPQAVAELLGHLGRTVSIGNASVGASCLSEDKPIGNASVTIYDDATHPLHRGMPFDLDGVARQRVSLIESGDPGDPVSGWLSGHRFGVPPTGHQSFCPQLGAHDIAEHLVMVGDEEKSLDELCLEMGRGLLIHDLRSMALWDPRHLRIAGVTHGLYLVEDGQLLAPVQDRSFEVSLLELFREVVATSQVSWAKGSVVPALRVVFSIG